MGEKRRLKNIIFDVGDVLLEYRWKDMLVDFGLSEEEAQGLGLRMFEDPLWKELDLANRTEQEIIRSYQEKIPQYKKEVEWFITHGEYMHVNRPKVWEKVHRLKEQGYGLYLLSNYSKELFIKHTKGASFIRDMDGMVVSYMIHQAKPSREIYEYLLQKYHLNPQECLFFDDREENVLAARKLGIDAYQVTSQAYLLEQLERLLSGGKIDV